MRQPIFMQQYFYASSYRKRYRSRPSAGGLLYTCPPEYFVVDQEAAHVSHEIRKSAKAFVVGDIEAPVQTRATIGTVERNHAPLTPAYKKVIADLGRYTSDEECLALAVFTFSTAIAPEGLCPIFLVPRSS